MKYTLNMGILRKFQTQPELREQFDNEHDYRKFVKQGTKLIMSKFLGDDILTKSLEEEPRVAYDEWNETEFGFLPDGTSVEEAKIILKAMWVDDDTVGEFATIGISMRVNPNGRISYVHRMVVNI